MLRVSEISTCYGKVNALWAVSLEVKAGEIVSLVGNNGAGKTTILDTISGLLVPASGLIEFQNRKMNGLSPYEIVRQGLSQVPEGGRPFPDMSVLENLELGAYVSESWKNRNETLDHVYEMFPVLKQRGPQLASTLSGGERQMLAIARSLMSRPVFCMFDEPSYGLAPIIVSQLFETVGTLRERGITILIVEQNVKHALEAADRAYVLENGRIALQGDSADLIENDEIRKAYLGL